MISTAGAAGRTSEAAACVDADSLGAEEARSGAAACEVDSAATGLDGGALGAWRPAALLAGLLAASVGSATAEALAASESAAARVSRPVAGRATDQTAARDSCNRSGKAGSEDGAPVDASLVSLCGELVAVHATNLRDSNRTASYVPRALGDSTSSHDRRVPC